MGVTTVGCYEGDVVSYGEDEHAEDVEHVEVYHEHEVKVISNAYTIVEPRAMVIHSLNALVTDVAVLGPGSLDYFARGAALNGVDHLEEFLTKKLIRRWKWNERATLGLLRINLS